MIKNLSDTAVTDIVDCLNLAFADYSVSMEATADYWSDRWKAADIDYNLSFGYFNENRLGGFILHGTRELDGQKCFFNMGTGVIPACRGKRLVKKLYDYCLPILRNHAFDCGYLEVITSNSKAIKAYQSAGFGIIKTLHCFKGMPIKQVHPFAERQIKKCDTKKYEPLQRHYLSWEQNAQTINTCPDQFEALELIEGDVIVGFAIIKKANGNVTQFGVLDADWASYGMPLFSSISKLYPQYRILNIDATDLDEVYFFKQNNFPHLLDQYEMKIEIR